MSLRNLGKGSPQWGRFSFRRARLDDNELSSNFLLYLLKRFADTRKKWDHIRVIDRYLRRKRDDATIFTYLRELQAHHHRGGGDLTAAIISQESRAYSLTIERKVEKLRSMLESLGVTSVASILDVGTESLLFLDRLEAAFPIARASVRGINIGSGFCHYDSHFDSKMIDPRFQIYDGVKIPFPDKSFELITLYSVVHHIEDQAFAELAHELARVGSKWLLIKDVSLERVVHRETYILQHEAYEGVLLPGEPSYRNENVTLEKTSRALLAAGFQLLLVEMTPNFNNTYHAVYQLI